MAISWTRTTARCVDNLLCYMFLLNAWQDVDVVDAIEESDEDDGEGDDEGEDDNESFASVDELDGAQVLPQ